MILAGHIESPESVFWLIHHTKAADGRVVLDRVELECPVSSERYSSLASMISALLSHNTINVPIYAAVFSVPGIVRDRGRSAQIQRPAWGNTSAQAIAEVLPAPVPVVFLNDMEAMGYGVFSETAASSERRFIELTSCGVQPLRRTVGGLSMVLLTVGGGFGQSFWSWNEETNDFDVLPSEGGHTDFAPRTDVEMDFYQFLRNNTPNEPISYERVLSANGLTDLYRFFSIKNAANASQARLSAGAIVEASNKQEDTVASEAVAFFASVLGAEAGNTALQYLPEGGVYIAGGIVPAMLPSLQRSAEFTNAFCFKEGAFRSYTATVPVFVIEDAHVCLRGASVRAIPLLTRGFWVHKQQKSEQQKTGENK